MTAINITPFYELELTDKLRRVISNNIANSNSSGLTQIKYDSENYVGSGIFSVESNTMTIPELCVLSITNPKLFHRILMTLTTEDIQEINDCQEIVKIVPKGRDIHVILMSDDNEEWNKSSNVNELFPTLQAELNVVGGKISVMFDTDEDDNIPPVIYKKHTSLHLAWILAMVVVVVTLIVYFMSKTDLSVK